LFVNFTVISCHLFYGIKFTDIILIIIVILKMHVSAANGYREVTRFLINAGANVDQQDDYGYTALHLAAKFNHVRTKCAIVVLILVILGQIGARTS